MKRGLVTTAILTAGIAALFTLRWFPLSAGVAGVAPAHQRPAAREVVLVARGMAFYLGGSGAPNPVLRVRPGERIRLVLRNEEPGVTHNFAVPGWDIATSELRGSGDASVEFEVPSAAGKQVYQCTPHSAMMRGRIEIE